MGNQLATAGSTLTAAQLNRCYGQADGTSTTVTAATTTQLSSSYSIPANDAQAGTAYRLTGGGWATWGSTQQNLTFAFSFGGGTPFTSPVIDSTAFAISLTLRWVVCVTIVCVAPGASATWFGSAEGVISATTNLVPGTAANGTVGFGFSNKTVATQDSTAAIAMFLQGKWASTTGASTITNTFTLFEKVN